MTITISASGIALDGPLVAGEKVSVSVSGLALAAEDKPTLALLARFPDALLASVELAEDANAPGTWTGELDTATKQTALFFATARADERRDAALELVAGRVSLARLTVPMANSALCPKPDGSPFASPVYIPVPGPPGTGGDPYDQAPEMDGEASAGTADEYARGDHRHPTDTTRQAVIEDLAAIRSGAAAGATAVQPSALSAYRTASAQDAIDSGKASAADVTAIQNVIPSTATPSNKLTTASDLSGKANDADVVKLTGNQTVAGDKTFTGQFSAADIVTGYSFGFKDGKYITAPANTGAALTAGDLSDQSSALGAALAAKADSSSLATVATTGDYDDLTNKPTIPDVSGKADSASIAPAFSTSSTYAVGDYVTRDGLLYKCTTAVSTAGAWNAANWSAVSAMEEIPAPITVDSAMSSSSTNPVQNKVVNAAIDGRVPWANAAKNAVTIGTRSGVVGDYSVAQGVSVTATGARSHAEGDSTTATEGNAHAEGYSTSATGISSHAEGRETTAAGAIAHSEGLSTYAAGRPSHSEGEETTAAGIASHADGYRAVTAASGNGSGATTPHDYAFAWQGVSTGGYYRSHGAGTFNINPVPASGSTDPATGFWIGETKLSDYVRYAFASPTPSVSGTSATVACEDRAINDITVATGITSLTITPPAAVTGRARDFFCRVTLTDSSLPTVTLSGGTIDIGATEVAGMTQGVNLLMFTEIASGHWLASRRSAS